MKKKRTKKFVLEKIKKLFKETGDPPDHYALSKETGIPLKTVYCFTNALARDGLITKNKAEGRIFVFLGDTPASEFIAKNRADRRGMVLDVLQERKGPQENGGWYIKDITAAIKTLDTDSVWRLVNRLRTGGFVKTETAKPVTCEPI